MVTHDSLTSDKIQEHVEDMGYATFAILFAVLDIGFVVIRVTELVALSGTPGLAAGLVIISFLPSVILPLLIYTAKLAKGRRHVPDGEEV